MIINFSNIGGGSGSGGTTNYNDLSNKPTINNVTLSGETSISALGAQAYYEVDALSGVTAPKEGDIAKVQSTTTIDLATTYSDFYTKPLNTYTSGDIVITKPATPPANYYWTWLYTQDWMSGFQVGFRYDNTTNKWYYNYGELDNVYSDPATEWTADTLTISSTPTSLPYGMYQGSTSSGLAFNVSATTSATYEYKNSNWASYPYTYTLPTASDTTLGGVKVGSGLTITDGVLSVSGGTEEGQGYYEVDSLSAVTSPKEGDIAVVASAQTNILTNAWLNSDNPVLVEGTTYIFHLKQQGDNSALSISYQSGGSEYVYGVKCRDGLYKQVGNMGWESWDGTDFSFTYPSGASNLEWYNRSNFENILANFEMRTIDYNIPYVYHNGAWELIVGKSYIDNGLAEVKTYVDSVVGNINNELETI